MYLNISADFHMSVCYDLINYIHVGGYIYPFSMFAYMAKFIWEMGRDHLVGETYFPSDKNEVIIRRYNK